MAAFVFILVCVWVVSGAFAYAITFADLQRRWPGLAAEDYRIDRWRALTMALLGVCGLGAALMASECARRGLKWR